MSPRPVIVPAETGEVVLRPIGGFRSGDAEDAFSFAEFELAAALPNAPTRRDGYPIISAAQALKLLRNSGKPDAGMSVQPLRIVGLSLGTGWFPTDRGWSKLPAWRIRLAGVSTSAAVLAVGRSGVFDQPRLLAPKHPGFDSYPESAAFGVNDRTLIIEFVAAHSGNQQCDASYTATVTQNTTAVAVRVHAHPASMRPHTACLAIGYGRTVRVDLSRPLGARVLVDAVNGGIVPVYPRGTPLRLLAPRSPAFRHQPRFP